MEREQSERIAARVAAALGPEWRVGDLRFNAPFYFVCPELVEGKPERDPLMLLWEGHEAAGILAGTGKVWVTGEVLGKQAPSDKPLEDVLTAIIDQWQARKDKKRRGLFGW